jgi:hypothetical protein
MGLVKARMMELEELEASGALAEFICPNPECRWQVSEYVHMPVANMMADKQSDINATETTDVECPNCRNDYAVIVTNDAASVVGSLDDFPDVVVYVEPPDWYYKRDNYEDDWLYAVYDTPQSVYRDDCDELDVFIAQHCTKDSQNLHNRMALMLAWSIFETYLADQLAAYLTKHNEALIRFARHDATIKDLKLNAALMIEQNLTAQDEVVRAVKDRLFHQFGKPETDCSRAAGVPKWYSIGLNLQIEPDLEKLDRLRFFAALRHDCVHRNGRNKSGQLRADLTQENIVEMRSLMDRIVAHISQTVFRRTLEHEAEVSSDAR